VLTANGTAFRGNFLATGSLGCLSPSTDRDARLRIANAKDFGRDNSWPQGYQSVNRALVPPLATSGQIAITQRLALALAPDVRAQGNMAAAPALDVDMTIAANVLRNLAASLGIEIDQTSAIRAVGNMSSLIDLLGRPSAVDVSQEVWNGFQMDGMSAADAFRIMLAALAGKVSGAASTTVTIRAADDSKPRIVATVDADGNRTAVTLDGG
jgi:hypothetical protein